MAAALLAVLARPRWWLLSLAAFLVRGGFVALFLPIAIPPTAAGLANLVAPTLVGFVFGGPSVPFLVLVATAVALCGAWLVGGGLLGAWLDVALAREVAADDELETALTDRPGRVPWAFVARLAAHLPTLVVLAWTAVRIVGETYAELLSPGDPDVPLAVRVVARIPETLVLASFAWLVGEAVGGLAVRRIAAGAGLATALADAWLDLVRRPSAAATLVLTDVILGGLLLLAALVTSVTWDGLRIVLVDGGTAIEIRTALLLFGGAWLGGAWLISLAAAFRQVAWTFEVLRRPGR